MNTSTRTRSSTSRRALRVLVVEDHPINQRMAITALQSLGHTGMLAKDGASGLRCLAQGRFDLVLLDVMMPVMDGLEALARIRLRDAQDQTRTPVILATANDLPGDRDRYRMQGADGYIAKPVTAQALQAEIEAVLPQAVGALSRAMNAGTANQ